MENKDFCNAVKLPEDTEILEFNQYQKFDKTSFIICADLKYVQYKSLMDVKIILKIHPKQ